MATLPDTESLHLGPRSNGTCVTPWEFDAAEFEPGWTYQLVNGVLIVNPSPAREERDPNEELGHLLRLYQEQHPQGAALDTTLSEETLLVGPHRRRVDRAIWAGLGRLPHKYEPPTIAVEFVSQGMVNRDRDQEIKRHEYHGIGVREYWIIDRFERQMIVWRFGKGEPVKRLVTARQSYTTPLLPGFKLPLGRLLKLADRWSSH